MFKRQTIFGVILVIVAFVSHCNSQLQLRSRRNLSFSNIISNYLTKYPANIINKQKHNHRSPLTSHKQNRVLQLTPSTTNNKDVVPRTSSSNLPLSKQNPISQNQNLMEKKMFPKHFKQPALPVRIKLPTFLNKLQNVKLKDTNTRMQSKPMKPNFKMHHTINNKKPFKSEKNLLKCRRTF